MAEHINEAQFDIPVVMIVFRRLDLVKQVFNSVRELKPAKLYIISDGPRNEAEEKQVNEVREFIESNIDWDCQVKRNYATKNIGLRFRMPTGVEWVFEHEDKAIFLEDDILPDQSFFWFCREMLEKYENDNQIMMVSGMNVYPDHEAFGDKDIIFSRIPLTWGWATWKRAWERYDVNIKSWRNPENKKKLKSILQPNTYRFFVNVLDDLQYHWINDAWDYQWEYAMFINDGAGIIPRFNMIRNLGINTEGAEHTGDSDKREKMISLLPVKAMMHPYNLPDNSQISAGLSEGSAAININTLINNSYEQQFQKDFYPKVQILKYLKQVYRAGLNEKAYQIIKELEQDDKYFNNYLDDRYKLSVEEQSLYGGDSFRQVSGRELREAAGQYKKYKKHKK